MTTRPASDRPHDLLPWYANGTLGEEDSRVFREHLRQCDACREEMDAIEQIRGELEQRGDALLEDHPTSEQLVATALGILPAAIIFTVLGDRAMHWPFYVWLLMAAGVLAALAVTRRLVPVFGAR